MRPPEACVLQMNDALWCHPKEVPNHAHGPFPGLCPAGGMTSIRTVFSHFQKTTKNIFFASTWPTNTNTFYYILKKKHSYVYCDRLTETCHNTCILLLSQWSDFFYYSPPLYVTLDKSVCEMIKWKYGHRNIKICTIYTPSKMKVKV